MTNRLKTALGRWFGLALTGPSSCDVAAEKVSAERRQFFKRAAVGVASIAGTAGVAKSVVDSMPDPDIGAKYAHAAHQGEKELLEREYVLMSEQEKASMLEELIATHKSHQS